MGRASAQYTTLKRPIMHIEGDQIASICIIVSLHQYESQIQQLPRGLLFIQNISLSCNAAYLHEVRASLLYGQVTCNSPRFIY